MAQDNSKKKAIDNAINQIEKQFGKGSIMRLGGDYIIPDIPIIPTGSISLDRALGIGGIPRGRVIEIYGPESLRQINPGYYCS
jgi:recombination protein RecA